MIEFAWHIGLHARAGLIALVAGSVIYAAGSVVMARPYISSPVALLAAIPLAAVAGLLVLGRLVLLMAVLWVMVQGDPIFDPVIERLERGQRRRNRRRDL